VSLVIRFSPPSLTAAQYDDVVRRLTDAGVFPAEGLDYELCFGSDGNLKVSQVWDTKEHLDAFGERLADPGRGRYRRRRAGSARGTYRHQGVARGSFVIARGYAKLAWPSTDVAGRGGSGSGLSPDTRLPFQLSPRGSDGDRTCVTSSSSDGPARTTRDSGPRTGDPTPPKRSFVFPRRDRYARSADWRTRWRIDA
jgi:hypothetical protein